MNDTALSMRGVSRRFQSGDGWLSILRGVDLDIRAGEVVALVAPSGTGKSTLLHLAGLLERPDSGDILIGGQVAHGLSDVARTALRRDHIGFVYQFHHLLGEFSARENVILPQLIAHVAPAQARARADDLLGRFGLSHRLHQAPGKLSGGEQQRTAIARALANRPRLLLADEPTGNLDVQTSDIVFDELVRIARADGVAALIATHNDALAARMDRVLTLRDGQIVTLRA